MLDYNEWRINRGLPSIIPSFRKKIRTVSLSDEAHNGLKKLAEQYGAIYGGTVSLSRLLEMIGLHFLKIVPQDEEDQLVGTGPDRSMRDELEEALNRVAPQE